MSREMVSLEFGSFREFVELYAGRISEQGMYIETAKPGEVGSNVEFEVALSDNFRLLHGTGEVIWSVGVAGILELPPGMAIRFKDTDEPSRRLIARLVDKRRKSGGEVFSLERPAVEPAVDSVPEPAPDPAAAAAATGGAGPDLLASAQDLWRNREPSIEGPLDPLGELGAPPTSDPPSLDGPAATPSAPLEPREAPGVPAEPAAPPAAEPHEGAEEPPAPPLFPGVEAPAQEPPEAAPSESVAGEEIFAPPPDLAPPPDFAIPPGPADPAPLEEPISADLLPPELAAERAEEVVAAPPPLLEPAEPTPGEPLGLGELEEGDLPSGLLASDAPDLPAPRPIEPAAEGSMEFWMSSEPVAEKAEPEAAEEDAEAERPEDPDSAPAAPVPPRPLIAESPTPETAPGPVAPSEVPPPAAPIEPPAPVAPPAAVAPPSAPVELPDEADSAVAPPLAGAAQVRPARQPRVMLLAALLLLVALVTLVVVQRDRLRSLMGAGGADRAVATTPAPEDLRAASEPDAEPEAADEKTAPPGAGEGEESADTGEVGEPQPETDAEPPSSDPEPSDPEPSDAEPSDAPVVAQDRPVLTEPDESAAPALPPATRLERITWQAGAGETELALEFDGAVRSGDYEILRVEGGAPREVIRLYGLRPFAQPRFEVGSGEVLSVRTGFHNRPTGAELHVVIDLASAEMAVTGVQTGFRGLRIKISPGG
jgi:uncharacterized protein (TIGR02266 family)